MHAAFEAGLENTTLRPVVSRELPLAEAGHCAPRGDGGEHFG